MTLLTELVLPRSERFFRLLRLFLRHSVSSSNTQTVRSSGRVWFATSRVLRLRVCSVNYLVRYIPINVSHLLSESATPFRQSRKVYEYSPTISLLLCFSPNGLKSAINKSNWTLFRHLFRPLSLQISLIIFSVKAF